MREEKHNSIDIRHSGIPTTPDKYYNNTTVKPQYDNHLNMKTTSL